MFAVVVAEATVIQGSAEFFKSGRLAPSESFSAAISELVDRLSIDRPRAFAVRPVGWHTHQTAHTRRLWRHGLLFLAVLFTAETASAEVLVSTQAGDAAYEKFYQQPTSYTVTTARWGIYQAVCYLNGVISEPNYGLHWTYNAGPGNYELGCTSTLEESISGALAASGRMALLMMSRSGVPDYKQKFLIDLRPSGTSYVQGKGIQTIFSENFVGDSSCNEPSSPRRGDPIDISTGNVFENEIDFLDPNGAVDFRRYYNSLSSSAGSTPIGWSHSFGRRLNVLNDQVAAFVADDRRVTIFSKVGGLWKASPVDRHQLVQLGNAWQLRHPSGTLDVFDASGRLSTTTNALGQSVTMTYAIPSRLATVTDWKGRKLGLTYDGRGMLSRLTLPNSAQLGYGYESPFISISRLSSVNYSDGSRRRYLYADLAHTFALTALVDEAEALISSWTYDTLGRATRAQGPGGAGSTQVLYGSASAEVTGPTGTKSIVGLLPIEGLGLMSSQSQAAGAGCAASLSVLAYDSRGNTTRVDDFNGNRTCFAFDSRNLEVARVEGLATGLNCDSVIATAAPLPNGARQISTRWHPDWRMPTETTLPGRKIVRVYNGQPDPFNGNAAASCAPASAKLPDTSPIAVLCRQVEQATTDIDGALGFTAPLQSGIPAREQRWTYNEFGQVLTHDGPRTDINDITTYEYYPSTNFTGTDPNAIGYTRGDLKQVTNAVGQVTRYTLYDKLGQLLETQDANGVVTRYTYDARQRMTSVNVGGQATLYSYWPTGLIRQVTQPDASWVFHEYDDAQRLVKASDNLGNSVSYVLDNMGNRKEANFADPSGSLRRKLLRDIDALGRVQLITGRE